LGDPKVKETASNIRPCKFTELGADAGVDIGHARGIHVDDNGQKVCGAWATGRKARRGAPLFPESPSEEDGARLPIGREHRPQKRRRDLHTPTHRFEEVQDEVVVALGPIKR
jgi:hypothetical protein